MSLIRHQALVLPEFDHNLPVLFDDGSGDLWYIDTDGDILFWDGDEEPDYPYQVRRTDVKLGETDDNDILNRAFAESVPVIGFQWDRFAEWAVKQERVS